MSLPNGQVIWKDVEGQLVPFVDGTRVAWAAQAGSQHAYLNCPVFEVLYEGTRGPGKTDALLMSFYQHVGKGWGAEWRGVIFRRTYPELEDVINKSLKWFTQLCPQAKYNRSEHVWTFPDGEQLLLRHFDQPAKYWAYHGHNFTFIGWEELCTWPTDECLVSMISTVRSTAPGIPLMIRATANPYGVGHNWVKGRYNLPSVNPRTRNMVGKIISDEDGNQRVAIHGKLIENKVLLHADPNYITRLRASASSEAQLKAWLDGDWNIVAGGMVDDLWRVEHHVLESFPAKLIPWGWKIDRSFDWGQSKPFSVGWWAESNGEPLRVNNTIIGPVRGDLIRIAEWYGYTGKANVGIRMLGQDIARGIVEREQAMNISGRVRIGPADTSIFDDFEPGKSIAGEMRRQGVLWEEADKRPGSRKQGWDQLRTLLRNALPNPDGPREDKGIFVLDRCDNFIRTVPVLPRKPSDMDDVDTDAEDHIADETRYRIRRRNREITSGSWK